MSIDYTHKLKIQPIVEGINNSTKRLNKLTDKIKEINERSKSSVNINRKTGQSLEALEEHYKSQSKELVEYESNLKRIEKRNKSIAKLDTLKRSVDDQAESVTKLSKEIKEQITLSQRLKERKNELNRQIQDNRDEMKKYSGSSKENIEQRKKLRAEIEKSKNELNDLSIEEKENTDRLKENRIILSEKRRELKKSSNQYAQAEYFVSKYDNKLKESGIDTSKLSDETERLKRENEKLEQSFRATGEQIDRRKRKVRGFSNDLALLGSRFAGLFAGVAVGAGAVQSVSMGFDFERQLSRVVARSMADGSRADQQQARERFRLQAMDLGRTTAFSPVEVASAQELLSASGLAIDKILSVTPKILTLARAGDITLKDASKIATDIQSSFGISGEIGSDIAEIGDILAYTASSTKTDILELGEAFEEVGAIAKILFGDDLNSVRRTAAAFGQLAQGGIRGSVAGNALQGVFSALLDEQNESRLKLEELGVDFIERKGERKGEIRQLSDILNQISVALSALPNYRKAAIAEKLVGEDAASGFLNLLEKVREGTQKELITLEKQLEQVTGYAERVASIYDNDAKAKLEEFSSATDAFKIEFTNNFLPYITDTINAATWFMNKLNFLLTEHPLIKVLADRLIHPFTPPKSIIDMIEGLMDEEEKSIADINKKRSQGPVVIEGDTNQFYIQGTNNEELIERFKMEIEEMERRKQEKIGGRLSGY